jgi:hypothetical protein
MQYPDVGTPGFEHGNVHAPQSERVTFHKRAVGHDASRKRETRPKYLAGGNGYH